MEFGAVLLPHPKLAAQQASLVEARGFTHAWFPDLPVLGGDVYACLALAATATHRVKLGTHIAVAPLRPAPVTVHSIATINTLAPGRVVLGFGSGSFTRSLMGLPPMKVRHLRAQVRVIRELLDRGEAVYETEGVRRSIRFLGGAFGCINLEPRIPLYVAASAPRVAALAGEDRKSTRLNSSHRL